MRKSQSSAMTFGPRRFDRSPDVMGQTMFVKGVPFTIIGVTPPGFTRLDRGTGRTDFWIPLQDRVDLNAWGDTGDHGKWSAARPMRWLLLLTAAGFGDHATTGSGQRAAAVSDHGLCSTGRAEGEHRQGALHAEPGQGT